MLRLHNPSNLRLPPLMVEKTVARQDVENSPKVVKFISSNLLLQQDFYDLANMVCEHSKRIHVFINELANLECQGPFHCELWNALQDRIARNSKKWEQLEEFWVRRSRREKLDKNEQRQFSLLRASFLKSVVIGIKRHSIMIQNHLSRFESAHRISLDILTPITLYVCRRCSCLVSTDRFSAKKCICGEKISTVSKTRRESIAYFDRQLQSFIENNQWFEHGVDYLLRRKNCQTLCGVHVLGHSGNIHEVDNIAELKSATFRFLCECKTGSVTTNDIFIVAGKMADIGCSKGYIFTLSGDVPEPIRHLGRSRNISIVMDVLRRPEVDILYRRA